MHEHSPIHDQDQPWPWGTVEEHLAEYEQFLIGAIYEEPILPDDLTDEERKELEYGRDFLVCKYEGDLDEAQSITPGVYRELLEFRSLPELSIDS